MIMALIGGGDLVQEAVGGVGDGYKNRLNEYDDDHSQDYGQCGLWGRGKAFTTRFTSGTSWEMGF